VTREQRIAKRLDYLMVRAEELRALPAKSEGDWQELKEIRVVIWMLGKEIRKERVYGPQPINTRS